MDSVTPVTETSERHSRLLGIKLRVLVAEHLGGVVASETAGFPHGAALVHDDAAWVLIEGPAARSLGGALAWTVRQGAASLNIVADSDTGMLARRAERLSLPTTVWSAQDRTLLAAVAEPLTPAPQPAAEHLALTGLIVDAGATPNVEHGVVSGEVRGLEVCRVVDEPTIGHIAELGDIDSSRFASDEFDGVYLEVGVGANDREAFRLIHGDIPTIEALASVVNSVVTFRSPDAPQHPLNRLGQERYLRWRLEQEPELVGFVGVEPSQPPQPRPNLKDPIPCVASGVDVAGRRHAIVCSVGVDVDLVGFVADVQSATDDPVVVVLKERDLLPITRELLGLLATPVDVRTV